MTYEMAAFSLSTADIPYTLLYTTTAVMNSTTNQWI